ncbi:DUF3237 family protein [Phenylobacterium aquaticum]|uniref:DUF3237 family protein n=1 Tax=Phenylobacterium aquaticum TaxID=1763816 RepID=UPI0026F15A42|nr:DUF3237 family protein [Phenylobacterium aquaticum]
MRGEKIYEYTIEITGLTDFGVSMEAIMTGRQPIPPQGARFDFTFEGRATGRIAGRLHGTDYYHMRADGRGELNIRAVLETDDGHRIALTADGVTTPRADGAVTDLFENVQLITASPDYAWVNARQIWAVGSSADGKIHVEAFMQ